MNRRPCVTLLLIALLAVLLAGSGGPAALAGEQAPAAAPAATYRTWIAQVPVTPAPTSTVRVWMDSDTAYGETAGLEYNIGASYTRVLGTWDNTSYPGANWYADIPAQAAGTTVQYQLFTRNQSGGDYGFTGFNWSYTVDGSPCAGASVGDNNVYWAGLFHDSFAAGFRSPTGAVEAGSAAVTLKFRTCRNDVQSASIRVWDDRANTSTVYALTFDSDGTVAGVGDVTTWAINLTLPTDATILYYVFSAADGAATAYYRDDDPKFYGGGYGAAEGTQSVAYDNSYQLTVYAAAFDTPEWMQRGVAYQVFPDRFRDGDSANNPAAGRFSYARSSGAIVRSEFGGLNTNGDWNFTVCDPRGLTGVNCLDGDGGYYSDNFYGGDLAGVIQKLEDGYFTNLGVSVLYLNPIFRSPSNHKYDTADYMLIDPDFGTLADFQELAGKAEARGIRLILDGVFNHTSSDSRYFDRYHRYDAAGNLTNPNGGADDDSGACEAGASATYPWFYFPDTGSPGMDNSTPALCYNGTGDAGQTYEAWYGYSSLPKLQANSTAVRSLIWSNGLSSAAPYWTSQGADGWRFDVGGDVDPGLTNDPANDYWEGFRTAVRAQNSQALTLGEEWGDASAWLLGSEWDSVMNYRFRSALLSWLCTGCVTGSGCTGGTVFEDNDSNGGSSSGAISAISPSQFNARLRSIAEDYPPQALKAMMNLEGSHDTNRVRFLLKKTNNDNDAAAVQRLKEWWLFAFTYPGAPTIYYGDEIGLNHDGVWANNKWEDDPYNRAPFPWPDATGSSYGYDATAAITDLQGFARHMASLRWSYRALQDGDVQHGLIIDDANQLYGYGRTNGTQTALIALNRSGSAHDVAFTGLNDAPYNLADGTILVNALDPALATYTVSGGAVSAISVPSTWGVVLLEKGKIDAPAAVTGLQGSSAGATVALSWPTVAADATGGRELATSYRIHRATTPDVPTDGPAYATVTPSDNAHRYGAPGGSFGWSEEVASGATYYYKVCAVNAAGVQGVCSPAAGPLAVRLESFTAVPDPAAGRIDLSWTTASETGSQGFNLWRAAGGGPGLKLNAALIPSLAPGAALGADYAYTDAAGLVYGTAYTYTLEAVDLSGAAETIGEATAVYRFPLRRWLPFAN